MHLLWPPDFGIATELILMCPLIHDTHTCRSIYIYTCINICIKYNKRALIIQATAFYLNTNLQNITDSRVMAKWKDGYYYPGIIQKVEGSRYM